MIRRLYGWIPSDPKMAKKIKAANARINKARSKR